MLLATTSAARDEAECSRLLATVMPSVLPCDLSGLVVLRDGDWRVVLQKSGELISPGAAACVLPGLNSLFDAVLSRDRLLLLGSDDRELPPGFETFGLQSLAVVPIRTLQSRFGMLLVGRLEQADLSREAVSLLQILSDHSAMAIENFRLHESLRRYSSELKELVKERTGQLERSESRVRLLLRTNNAMVGNLDRESLFRTVADALVDVLPFDRASISLRDPSRDVMTVSVLVGVSPSKLKFPVGTETPRLDSPLRRVIDEKRPVLCKDLSTKDRTPDEDRLLAEGIRSYLAVPLIAKDRAIGTLNVGSRSQDRYSKEDADVLSEIANQVALATENMLAYEEIERLKARLEQENRLLQEEIETQRSDEIVGESPAIMNLLEQIDLVAPTNASVLILGESGTGKELVAREIHKRSGRSDGPMIKVNCASVPRELYESEFFGHVKGGFTGAIKDRSGRFDLADGGTLFLDEVGEIPLELQGKLLRVLQEGQFERIGAERTRSVDVRVVAATNRDLKGEVVAGRFRQDLYYRLNVFPLEVPPLRDRKEDIPLLASRFFAMACQRMNRPKCHLGKDQELRLQGHEWPGNVRELQNAIERAVIISRDGILRFETLESPERAVRPQRIESPGQPVDAVLTYDDLQSFERKNILQALELAKWKIAGPGGAAEILGVRPTTLNSKLRSFNIRRRLRES